MASVNSNNRRDVLEYLKSWDIEPDPNNAEQMAILRAIVLVKDMQDLVSTLHDIPEFRVDERANQTETLLSDLIRDMKIARDTAESYRGQHKTDKLASNKAHLNKCSGCR